MAFFHVTLLSFLHNSCCNLEIILIIYVLIICLPPVECKLHKTEVLCVLLIAVSPVLGTKYLLTNEYMAYDISS